MESTSTLISLFFIVFLCGINTCANDTNNHMILNDSDTSNVLNNMTKVMSNIEIDVKNNHYILNHKIVLLNPGIILKGDSINGTIFSRNYNVSDDLIRIRGNNDKLQDFTVDGNSKNNIGNSGSEEIGIVSNNVQIYNIEVKNFSHIGIASNGKYVNINSCKIYGNSTASPFSSYGIWSASLTSIITIQNCDIENNELSGIYGGGYTNIINNYLSGNHIQTSPVGGGQIAVDAGTNIFSNIFGNIILNGGGIYTDGVEIGSGNSTITNNYVTSPDDGIVIDQGPVNAIISDNIIKATRNQIVTNGLSNVITSNNLG